MKLGGRLYTITDVEELHMWNLEVLDNNPLFRRIPNEEIVIKFFFLFFTKKGK